MNIFCVGRNYVDHAKELGNAVPESPVIFMKPSSALLTENTPLPYPAFSNDVHYEAELVLKICKSGKNINIQNANEYFNEITVGIDFTARDIQSNLKSKGLPWEKAKAWDGSAVVGNWKPLTKEMLTNTIDFSMTKNNAVLQKGNNTEMLFSFDAIIADISTYFSIEEGDLIFTGTPAGVGACAIGDILEGFLGNEKIFTVTIQ